MDSLSLIDLGEPALELIVQYLGPYGALKLRGTCTMMRAIIRAPRKFDVQTGRAPHGYEPRKRTPHQMWRWARRRGFAELEEEAIEAGARDIARYLVGIEPSAARKAWCDCFAREECAHYNTCTWDLGQIDNHISMWDVGQTDTHAIHIAIIRGDIGVIERECSREFNDIRMAKLIGKYASESMVRIAFASNANAHNMREYVIGGLVRSGRIGLARELMASLIAQDVSCARRLRNMMLLVDRPDLCADLEQHIDPLLKDAFIMFNSATRGGINALAYAHDHCDHRADVVSIIIDTTRAHGSAMCAMVRDWIDAAIRKQGTVVAIVGGDAISAQDFMRNNEMRNDMFQSAIARAACDGNKDALVYLRDWAMEYDTSLDFMCIMSHAVQHDKYWIVDLIAQWVRTVESDELMRDRIGHPLCDAVIRARLAKMGV